MKKALGRKRGAAPMGEPTAQSWRRLVISYSTPTLTIKAAAAA